MEESPHVYKFFADLIDKELGIQYSDENFFQLDRRLNDICKFFSFDSIQSLYEKCRVNVPEEIKLMILDAATNNETSFFRDVDVFAGIKEILSESEYSGSFKPPIKIWSAACSTGQEIYSLKILMDELASEGVAVDDVQVVATDYSSRVLERSSKGEYSQLEVQRGLSTPRLIKYFEQRDEGELGLAWKVKDSLKKGVLFKQQNLLESFSGLGSFHLILCRNVLIYQPPENKVEIVERMLDSLQPGGFLIMGGAESLIGINNKFEHVKIGRSVFYRKPVGGTSEKAA